MATSVSKPPCIVCKTPAITRCSRCKVVHYCSAVCQRKDWPTHKIACTPSTSTSTMTPPTSSTGKQPVLPDPSKPLNVQPVDTKKSSGPPPLRKPVPQVSSTSLKFKYQPSEDGVDENLVIFFHGLGDKIEPNFVKLAQSLQLPQTATCCIQAPTPVPYLEEEGWQWFPSFNNMTGELLGPGSPERMLQVKQLIRPALVKFLKHCIDYCGFTSQKIVLFGFSQGAEIALDLAAFGGLDLRAVMSIAGYFMDESQNDEPATKLNTRVMIVQGDKDDLRSVKDAKDKFKYVQRVFGKANTAHKIVEGMGHGMPCNEPGWRPLMEFFATNLHHRSTGLESMTDLTIKHNKTMMIQNDTDMSIPKFESTLVIAIPDVLMAGPKILLSSINSGEASSIPAWVHYCSTPSLDKKKSVSSYDINSSKPTKDMNADKTIKYFTATTATGQRLGLLTIATAPPTTEQASYLSEAIVKQAQISGTQRIVLVAASNFLAKERGTHLIQINHDSLLNLPAAPKDVALGDHILNTFLAMLRFTNVPTTALVHPAKKGTSLTETRTILESLATSLSMVIGGSSSELFSAERAFEFSVSKTDEEESTESMMYM
ncbi:hypothetical protein BGX28_001140 [Mortierella sp. GBA30]|nr:hypothetical protein BGX28_001140 [Mortierella sp. GBA30]